MEATICQVTVLFEDPYWVGVYERTSGDRTEVCKITFGAQPKDYEVYDFLLKHWHRLRFSPPVTGGQTVPKAANPKRLQRQIHRQLRDTGIGTRAQQALKMQQEQGKQERRTLSRERAQAQKDRRFALHREKRKEKHRGH